jgi:hypothetical protein
MAFEPDFETIAGTKLFIAAGKPTDDTLAAYETLFAAATGGDEFELTNVGAVDGRNSDIASMTVVSRGRTRQKPGTYTFPQADFTIQWLPESDAHQTADTALRTRAICSFRLERQSGVAVYFIGYVLNLADAGGGPNDALTGTLSILRDSETIIDLTP